VCLQEIEIPRLIYKNSQRQLALRFEKREDGGYWLLEKQVPIEAGAGAGDVLAEVKSKAAHPDVDSWDFGSTFSVGRTPHGDMIVSGRSDVNGVYTAESITDTGDAFSELRKAFEKEFKFIPPAVNTHTSAENNNGVIILLRRSKFEDVMVLGPPVEAGAVVLDEQEGTSGSAISCLLRESRRRLVLFNSHLDSGHGMAQGSEALAFIEKEQKNHDMILWCGDFNMNPTDPFFAEVKSARFEDVLGFKEDVHTQHLTFRASDRRDYILYRSEDGCFEIDGPGDAVTPAAGNQRERCEANLKAVGSDHSPVFASFRVHPTKEAEFRAKVKLNLEELEESFAQQVKGDEEFLALLKTTIQALVRRDWDQKCDYVEAKAFGGGFSGSLVLQVRPFVREPTGGNKTGEHALTPMHPFVLKFDDISRLTDEYEKYKRYSKGLETTSAIPEHNYVQVPLSMQPLAFCTANDLCAIKMELAGGSWMIPGLGRNQKTTEQDTVVEVGQLYVNDIARACRGDATKIDHRGPLMAFFQSNGVLDQVLSKSWKLSPASIVEKLSQEIRDRLEGSPREERDLDRVIPGVTSSDFDAATCARELLKPEHESNFLRSKEKELDVIAGVFRTLLQSLETLRQQEGHWANRHRPLEMLVHGDLNAANILVDIHQNIWVIDFSEVEQDSVMRDPAKIMSVLLFQLTISPLSVPDVRRLPVEKLAKQLEISIGQATQMKTHADSMNAARLVEELFTGDEQRRMSVRLFDFDDQCDEANLDGEMVLKGMLASAKDGKYPPLIQSEVRRSLKTEQWKLLAVTLNEVLIAMWQRMKASTANAEETERKANLHSAMLFLHLMLNSLATLTYGQLADRKSSLALFYATEIAKTMPGLLEVLPDQLEELTLENTAFEFIKVDVDAEREKYASQAQAEHGTVINPITGETIDIMQQCVNLQLDTGASRQVGDLDGYDEVTATFAEVLAQGMKAWILLPDSKLVQEGRINRVNQEQDNAITYDFQYDKVVPNEKGKFETKTFIVKDLPRIAIKTEQVLVKGDPAGGKTTFAKQLLTRIMRDEKSKWLVPVMIRTVDLVRNKSRFRKGKSMIDQFLEMQYSERRYALFKQARAEGRLLVILDGYDEAGKLESEIEDDIKDILVQEIFLVLTSRDMGGTFEKEAFKRFRGVRVMELNSAQQVEVITKRLNPEMANEEERETNEERVQNFLKQLELNPALKTMAKNPLLLNVTLAVFESANVGTNQTLNRGKVYSIALDGMFGNIEATKMKVGSTARATLRRQRSASMTEAAASPLRIVLRQVAYLAHRQDIRDFRDELIERAIEASHADLAAAKVQFTMEDWLTLKDLIKKNRVPVLAWFVEDGHDTFRFAHLTFQV
jgi:endonuclease/exonuclease/phosphatase family metal-dependent hydrolase